MERTLNLNKATDPQDVAAILRWAAGQFEEEGRPWRQIAEVLEDAADKCDDLVKSHKEREKWKKRDMRFG
jgi:hypothetical protein